jgi:hypothetical protein
MNESKSSRLVRQLVCITNGWGAPWGTSSPVRGIPIRHLMGEARRFSYVPIVCVLFDNEYTENTFQILRTTNQKTFQLSMLNCTVGSSISAKSLHLQICERKPTIWSYDYLWEACHELHFSAIDNFTLLHIASSRTLDGKRSTLHSS